MKPLIREWMDEHFPALLEGAVRNEVARVVKARGSQALTTGQLARPGPAPDDPLTDRHPGWFTHPGLRRKGVPFMLDKTFNPKEVEGRIYAQWLASGRLPRRAAGPTPSRSASSSRRPTSPAGCTSATP